MADRNTFENFDDLDELGIEADETTELFLKAADHVKNLVSKLDNKALLDLYGYYKQATEGPCNIPRPSWYSMKERSKWDAWDRLNKMSQNEAKDKYVELVKNLDSSFTPSANKEGWVNVSTFQHNENILCDSEKTLLDFIKEGNTESVIKLLQTNGAETLNELDEDGMGLIHWAADRGYHKIIEILISHGANVNLRDAEMQTALHYSAGCGHIECISVLLKNNADCNLKDDAGLEPKDVAIDAKVKDLLIH